MAITKIFPIKKTLHKAIKYIANKEKTESGTFLSTYQCGMYTADLEMEMTAKMGKTNGRKNDRKAYHIIQSFAKDDPISPEQAIEIGRQLAEKYTEGNHQFIVATHMDKDHIHNHIIFNATNFVDYSKIHIQNKDLDRLRDISDQLCEANGLSVIEKKSGVRGRGKYEYEQHKEGESWKDQLREAIDRRIPEAKNFDDFIALMEMEEGYEIKIGKYISFRREGQERFTRSKRLGENYSIEAICNRIENKDKILYQNAPSAPSERKKQAQKQRQRKGKRQPYHGIYLIEKIDEKLMSLEPEKSEAYRNALIRNEINSLVKSKEFLIRNGLNTPEEFRDYYFNIVSEFDNVAKTQSSTKNKILNLEMEIRQLQNYTEGFPAYKEFCLAKNKLNFVTDEKKYMQKVNYDVAKKYFDEIIKKDPNKISRDELITKRDELKRLAEQMPDKREKIFQSKKELEIIASNIKAALDIDLLKTESIEYGHKVDVTRKEDISL